ncbi:MAG: hypothetical protein ABJE47_03560 [bacterium]
MRSAFRFALAALVLPSLVSAQQDLRARLRAAGTRTVAFSARARPEVCGDGIRSYSDGLSGPRSRIYDGMLLTHEPWDTRIAPCEHGLVRVTVRVVEGTPSWLRTAAGPLPVLGDTVMDIGIVSAASAGEFLRALVRGGEGRVAVDAISPLVLIDSIPRWEILAAAAADSSRIQRYRRRASDLLARGAASTLGFEGAGDEDDAASLRREAVYAIARSKDKNIDPVPQLLDIARTNTHRDARVAAMYQLGQLDDSRALAFFATMLKPGSR